MKLFIASVLLFTSLTSFAKILKVSEDNLVVFDQAFDEESTSVAANELFQKCKEGKDLFLFLNTPGGSVIDGLNFIDFARSLPCKVHTITLFAASMGYITAQLLGTRYIIPSGVLMSHKGSLKIGGEFPGSFDSRVKFYRYLTNYVDGIVAERLGMTPNKYKSIIENELWLTANVAISSNHADQIVLVQCDKSLMYTKTSVVNTIFGKVTIKKSACPMIPGILGLEFSNEDAKNAAHKKAIDKTPIYYLK